MKKKQKIHKDKNGRDFIKESYFVGGKMKFTRVYVIDGIPAAEFYEKNATDMDHFMSGDYWLMSCEKDNFCNESHIQEPSLSDDKHVDLSDNKYDDLPF